jgi:hypothetical protein
MTLRVGFDMDGVLADLGATFRQIESDLFGPETATAPRSAPEDEAEQSSARMGSQSPAASREADRRSRAVWERIRAIENFWTTLRPINSEAVRRLHADMLQHRWEVVFITQRPSTAGDTVQRQTQRWLVEHGFEMPSVVVIEGSRGAAANALRLTHHVDDTPRHCVDVRSDSTAMPILISGDEAASRQARKLGMGVATSIGECLQLLEHASNVARRPSALRRLASLVGCGR